MTSIPVDKPHLIPSVIGPPAGEKRAHHQLVHIGCWGQSQVRCEFARQQVKRMASCHREALAFYLKMKKRKG